MKHIEELKIGATAILFCMIMLLVYAVIPQDGFVPSTKAPMPEIPSADSREEEDDYGFQIYTQESNYDDSYSSYEEDSSYSTSQSGTDTDVSTGTDTGNDTSQDTAAPDAGTAEEPPVSNETDPDISYVEEPSVDESYDSEAGEGSFEDEIDWNETEATYYYEE